METNQPRRAVTLRTILLRVGNTLARRVAGRRVYALLQHQGRRSGRTYTTPVVAWHRGTTIIVPLSFGTTSDWCQNVLAHNGCRMQLRGQWYAAHAPQLIPRDDAVTYLPPLARIGARLLPVATYIKLRTSNEAADTVPRR